MAVRKNTVGGGARVLGLGVMALGVVGLIWGDFVLGQTVPRGFPHRSALAYGAGVLLAGGGLAMLWRRTTAWGAGMLALYYGLAVVVLMNGRVLLKHPREYGSYSGAAEEAAILAGLLIAFSQTAKIGRGAAGGLARMGAILFGVCALLFGGAHFVYLGMTAPLIPKWLPPGRVFWAYATGIGFLAGGLALLTRVQARLGAWCLAAMLAGFAVLVHLPMLLADPRSHMNWTEGAINLAVLGAAWVVAETAGQARG